MSQSLLGPMGQLEHAQNIPLSVTITLSQYVIVHRSSQISSQLTCATDKQIVQNTMESSSDVSIWLKRASHMTANHLVSK